MKLLRHCLLVTACACGSHTPDPNAVSTTTIAPVTYDAVYVVNGGDSTISVINAESLAVVGAITLQNVSYPHHIYASQSGSRLLVAVPGMDLSQGHGAPAAGGHGGHGGSAATMKSFVLLLDADTGRLLASRSLNDMNHNATFSPDDREVWTTQMTSPGKVLILDSEKLEPVAEIVVGNMPAEITFSQDGTKAFVANGMSNNVSIVDVATRTVVKTIEVDEDPVGAWQGANGIAYVDNEEGKTLTAIDTQTLGVTLTYELGFTPGFAALAPDRQSVWVSNVHSGTVVLKSTDADTTLAEIATGAGAHAIVFSSDGTKAFVSNQEANTVSVIDVVGRTVLTTPNVGKKPNGLLWRSR